MNILNFMIFDFDNQYFKSYIFFSTSIKDWNENFRLKILIRDLSLVFKIENSHQANQMRSVKFQIK